jgi:hypothetical protein
MNVVTPTITMVRYDSFWDGFFSLHTFSFIFLTASVAAFVIALFRIIQSPSHHFKARSTLVTCFLPFVFCIAAALCDLSRLQWGWSSYYPSLWASNSSHMTLFGAALSTIAAVFYAVNHKQTNAGSGSTDQTQQ